MSFAPAHELQPYRVRRIPSHTVAHPTCGTWYSGLPALALPSIIAADVLRYGALAAQTRPYLPAQTCCVKIPFTLFMCTDLLARAIARTSRWLSHARVREHARTHNVCTMQIHSSARTPAFRHCRICECARYKTDAARVQHMVLLYVTPK